MIPPVMDMGDNYLEDLFLQDQEKWLPAVTQIKNNVIGNNKQKRHIMSVGIVPRLLQFMSNDSIMIELRTESAVVLGSLAKGTEDNIRQLIDAGCFDELLRGLSCTTSLRYMEACLRCLRTILMSSVGPRELLYQDPNVLPHMINILSSSHTTQECITSILADCCHSPEEQVTLCCNGVITALAPLLATDVPRVQMSTLRCLCALCYGNEQVACAVASTAHNGQMLPQMLAWLLQRHKPTAMQMLAAKCLTCMCRAGAIEYNDTIISHKALSTLVRMCKADKTWEERVEGAETLAYLIEVDLTLQRQAAMSDHIINTLSEYFKYPGSPLDATLMPKVKDDIIVGNELRQAAFRAYASLGANDENIRKQIIDTENIMEHIVNGLSDPVTKVQLAAVRCLHSLSRSVQQLRTSFQDHVVWKPLMKILRNSCEEVVSVASSTLCNLLLEFSPSKEPILESGVVGLLVELTKREDVALRLNGIWALMNMAFQCEQKIKCNILDELGADQLFRLLGDQDINVLMKTLGLLRNLLSSSHNLQQHWHVNHIDQIMSLHGTQVLQAVILILEGNHPIEVKEQALCILANVADGHTSKDFIMSNEDVLKKIMNYMVVNRYQFTESVQREVIDKCFNKISIMITRVYCIWMIHSNVKLQIAATFCISNLIWNEDEGALERQNKLRDMGVPKMLQQLLNTSDSTLYDKVKSTMQQF